MTTNFCTETATQISASSENTNFPASNLKNPIRSKRVRSETGTTTLRLVFDLQTTEDINSVVLLWPKEDGILLSETAVVKVQANATDVWTAPSLDETLTIDDVYMVASKFFSADQSFRYWSILIEDDDSAYGFVELGQAWIGKSLALDPIENGFKFSLLDQSKVTETQFGHRYIDEYPTQASLEFVYSLLDYADAQTLENAFRTNGTRKPVLVAVDDQGTVFDKDHFLIYGYFSSKFGLNHLKYDLLTADSIRIEETA